jgi:hypothetical protein
LMIEDDEIMSYIQLDDYNDPPPEGWEKIGKYYHWIGGNPPGDKTKGYWSILCRKIETDLQRTE